jgi:hypothetical protein
MRATMPIFTKPVEVSKLLLVEQLQLVFAYCQYVPLELKGALDSLLAPLFNLLQILLKILSILAKKL